MAINIKEERENSVGEIEKKLRESRDELLQTRLSKRTGQLEKPHLLKELRRDIARLESILNEKRRAAASA